ncbi:unnamed protein product [Diatraea saccharalis]|uniref:Uncharacterized protein n=1 Tax=Diatraea saccharalis TaxID=40085 RepID=A0A9N9WFW8_9NEOP|nr:unnamed protein product [Diatraea saccharalis]
MKLFLILAVALCAYAAEVKEKEEKTETVQNKDKRQTQDELVATDVVYRVPRKQEQVAPVEEPQEEDRISGGNEEYRPGQVFSLNAQELLELQPERKSPVSNDQLLQQLYTPQQQEHKQNLQQLYYLEPQPQVGRQVSLQPSHAVIARPSYSSNGGEASVGAALSVSDSGATQTQSFDQNLLGILNQIHQVRQDDNHQQSYSQLQPIQQTSAPNLAPQQNQQVDRYVTKPVKKTTKLRNKAQINPPQASAAPQQYLIETTNVQQQQNQQPQLQQVQPQQQYRPVVQQQRPLQALRYVPLQQAQPAIQQIYYERPESQGLKVVPAPKLQQLPQIPQIPQIPQLPQPMARPQLTYRIVPQYQQPEATPKQYRIIEVPRPQPIRQEPRLQAASVERPITYLKRYPEPEKMRAVKIYEPIELPVPQQPAQIIGEQYYIRPVYRQNEQRVRYDLPITMRQIEQPRPVEATKAPSSAIYVSKNLAPKKIRPQPVRTEQNIKIEQPTYEQQSSSPVSIEQQTQSLEEQRAQLPPPRNNKAYTPEEFAALVAAGYSVTPIPVGAHIAQSRSSAEPAPQTKRRPIYRRPQYLPIRDDAP